ncbi:MAG: DUF4340 domain-containing protein [Candidatus Firestonebacteria bacterium]
MSPKKKKFLSTWIVVGIFVVLGGVSLYLDKGDKIDREKIKIFDVVKDDIKSFELINNNTKEAVLCEKYGKGWAMVKPKPYEIEKTEVDIVVTNIAALTIDRKIEKPEALSNYGLEKPSYTVNFTLKNGKKKTLLIGDKNPTGTFYYVKAKDGAELYIGYSFSIETVMKNTDNLRKKTLFDADTDKISRVDLKYESKEFSLVKGDDKKWVINPYGFKAESEEVDKFISGMKELKAKSIVEDNGTDLKKYGLLTPRLTITSSFPDGKSLSVLIGKKHLNKDEDYAKIESSPVIYSLDTAYLRGADKTYNDFRAKKILYLSEDDFNEVEIAKGKKKIIARKGAGGKYAVLPPAAKGAEAAYSNFIRSVHTLTAKSFADDSGRKFEKYGLKNPGVVITLYNTENNEKKIKAKIALGEAVKTGCYAKIDSSESVFVISDDVMGKIKEIEKAAEAK